MMRGSGRNKEVNTPEMIGQSVRVRVRVTRLRLLGCSGRYSVGRGQPSSNRVSGISTRTMHLDNAPVHNSIHVTYYFTMMGIKTIPHPPYSFGYSLCSADVVMRQLSSWKRPWRWSLTRSHKRTSMGVSRSCWNGTTCALRPEEITSKGTRIPCVLSIKVLIRKKSGNI